MSAPTPRIVQVPVIDSRLMYSVRPPLITSTCGSCRASVAPVTSVTRVSLSNESMPSCPGVGSAMNAAGAPERAYPSTACAKRSRSRLSAFASAVSYTDGISSFAIGASWRGQCAIAAPIVHQSALAHRVAPKRSPASARDARGVSQDVRPELLAISRRDLVGRDVLVSDDQAVDDIPRDEIFPARDAIPGIAVCSQVGEHRQIPDIVRVGLRRRRHDGEFSRIEMCPRDRLTRHNRAAEVRTRLKWRM